MTVDITVLEAQVFEAVIEPPASFEAVIEPPVQFTADLALYGPPGVPGAPGISAIGVDSDGTPYVDPAGVYVGDDAHLEIIDGHYFAVKDDGSSNVELLVAPALGFGDTLVASAAGDPFLTATDVNMNWAAPVIVGGTFGWDPAHPDRLKVLFDCVLMVTVNVAFQDQGVAAVGQRYFAVQNSTYDKLYGDDNKAPVGGGKQTTSTVTATGRIPAGDYLFVDVSQFSGSTVTPQAVLTLTCLGRTTT